MADSAIIPVERIQQKILVLRAQRVIIDADLAELYGVPTKALNQAVKRNPERFPEDFMLHLTLEEAKALRSQSVTLGPGSGRGRYSKYRPYAFTEHGAIMAANVLKSDRAAKISVFVVRAFVRLRQFLATHAELARKLAALERRLDGHDQDIRRNIERHIKNNNLKKVQALIGVKPIPKAWMELS